MSNDFTAYLAELREKLNSVASVSEEKDIAYGHQFKIVRGSEKAVLTAYDGKKGRRLVWGGAESALRSELQAVVEGKPVSFLAQDVPVWQGMWAGSFQVPKAPVSCVPSFVQQMSPNHHLSARCSENQAHSLLTAIKSS